MDYATKDSTSLGDEAHLHIGIIGAGAAGLYTAMMLESLRIPGLSYELLEGSGRVGGRLCTHTFSDEPFDYADMGAMRYPHTPIMERVFRLFEKINVPLIDYHFEDASCPKLYNSISHIGGGSAVADPFNYGQVSGGPIPDDLVAMGPSKVIERAFDQWITRLDQDFKGALEELLEFDHYDVETFLRLENGFDSRTIEWLELTTSAKGLFKQSLVEAVLDTYHLAHTRRWMCINGGSNVLVARMLQQLEQSPVLHKRAMALGKSSYNDMLYANFEDGSRRSYHAVVCSIPLPCMRGIDVERLGLSENQMETIKTLHYDKSVKVAVKFDRPWWYTDCAITSAGSASTDMPIRACIYPSYGLSSRGSESSVLMASYTWAQDAEYLGSLVDRAIPQGGSELRDLVLNNLAELHGCHMTKGQLEDSYVAHHAFDWDQNPYAKGAFVLCSPGQFTSLVPSLMRPAADGRFYFIGEAASVYHGWLLGSLDSAYRAVDQLLERFGYASAQRELRQHWGVSISDMTL